MKVKEKQLEKKNNKNTPPKKNSRTLQALNNFNLRECNVTHCDLKL